MTDVTSQAGLRDNPIHHQRTQMLDPRTKLALILTMAIVLLTGGYSGVMVVLRPCLALIPFLLLILERKYALGFGYALFFAACLLFQEFAIPLLPEAMTLVAHMICGFFLRLAPGIAAAYYLLTTTTVSSLVASLESMHIPQVIVIPLSVMFRFFPTLGEESAAIGRAMRMRGIGFGGDKMTSMVEYRLIPLMMCSIRIGEELSAAALTRGLGAPIRRTTISEIGLGAFDFVIMIFCLATLICFILQGIGVL